MSGVGGVRHAQQSTTYKRLVLTGTLRATRKQVGATLKQAEIEPELRRIVETRRHDSNCKPLPVRCKAQCEMAKKGQDCEHAQTAAWRKLRDAYAEKNRDLARRAAERQWKRNRHLPGETVPCCTEPDAAKHHHPCSRHGETVHCTWCHGKKVRKCQPDLEALAYAGLLEAIHRFDPVKAGRISSYAVHLIKQSMLELLRQTPISFPQDLLRDRRVLAKLDKDRAKGTTALSDEAALLAIRPCRRDESMEQRLALARNCYYGNEKQSVEVLQRKYIENTARFEKRAPRGKVATVLDSLTASDSTDVRARRALAEALEELTPEHREAAELYLSGKLPTPPPAVVLALRDTMDVRMAKVLDT